MSDLAQVLEWDSVFFGKLIARANISRLDETSAPALLSWCASHQTACLYFLADSADPRTVRLAEANGFQFVDIRLMLERRTTAAEQALDSIRPFLPSDIPALKAIARVSHRDSRFYYDAHFSETLADRLYETWIENSCSGYADQVLVAVDADVPVGYITCRLSSSHGEIGLLSVAASAQGKGYGSHLIQAALVWFATRGAGVVTVVTQGRNVAAQRAYQKNGFLTKSVHLWYHRWF